MPDDQCADIFEFEHVVARSAGGDTTADNWAWACPNCNRRKAARSRAVDPETGRRVPLFIPRRQRWTRHFPWSDDLTEIIGRTATGRATVAALQMNRPTMRNLRRAWVALGVHPAQRAAQ